MCGIETVRMGVVLYLFHFRKRSRHVGVTQLIQQLIHVLGRLSHRLIERFLGISIFAEEFRQRQTRVDNLHDDSRVVELTADALTGIGHIQLTTDIAVVQVFHHRNSGRRFEIQQPTFQTFLLSIGA